MFGLLRLAGKVSAAAAVPALALAALGCSTTREPLYSTDPASFPLPQDIDDARGRFREIFCAVLEERGETIPDHRPCSEALTRVGVEPVSPGGPVDLGRSRRELVVGFVSGLGWDCVETWLRLQDSARDHVHRFGYDLVGIEVETMSSSAANATMIREVVMAMDLEGEGRRLVLIGYSKGAVDILEAIVSYPEIRERVAAFVSLAGAVGGSPVADEVTQKQLGLLRHWPGAQCSSGDGGAMDSLRPAMRKAWLAANSLPEGIRYYSLLTCPEYGRISPILKPFYRKLRKADPRNDGMVPLDYQLLPGSTLLGCVNADHWAVAVPVARSHPNIAALFADENDYPREALLEAVLRFVEEDLDGVARRSRPARETSVR